MRTPTTRRTATAAAVAFAVPVLLAGLAPAGFVAPPDHAASSSATTRAQAPAAPGSQDPVSGTGDRELDDDAGHGTAARERPPAPTDDPGEATTRGDGDTDPHDEPEHADADTDSHDEPEHADADTDGHDEPEHADADTDDDSGTPEHDDEGVEAVDGEGVQEASGSTEQQAGCEPFAVHTPTSSEGATHAVAITSQTLTKGRRGWERVAWEASSRAGITGVLLVREDGVQHLDEGDLRVGSAESVLEIGFCGDPGPRVTPPPERPLAGTPSPTDHTVPEDDTEAPARAGTGSGGSGEQTGTGSGGASDGQTGTGSGGASDGQTGTASGNGSGEGSPSSEEQVEVLGVQLQAEGEPGARVAGTSDASGGALPRTGAEVPRLAAGGLLGLLLGTATLLGGHRLRRSASGPGTDHAPHAPGAGRDPQRGRA